MNRELLNEIVKTYEKYAWNFKALVTSENSKTHAHETLVEDFDNIEVRSGEIDAAWFSRPSKNNRKAWELRHIGEQPIAIFETVPNDMGDEESAKIRNEMETRLLKLTSKK